MSAWIDCATIMLLPDREAVDAGDDRIAELILRRVEGVASRSAK